MGCRFSAVFFLMNRSLVYIGLVELACFASKSLTLDKCLHGA